MTEKTKRQQQIDELRTQVMEAFKAVKRQRIVFGQKLIELRALVMASGHSWWPWFEANFDRAVRRTAEDDMRLAASKDPDAELAALRLQDRQKKQQQKQGSKTKNPRFPVENATEAPAPQLHLVSGADAAVSAKTEDVRWEVVSALAESFLELNQRERDELIKLINRYYGAPRKVA